MFFLMSLSVTLEWLSQVILWLCIFLRLLTFATYPLVIHEQF